MNVRQSACDRQALEWLLADRLDECEQSTLEIHLADCPACRQRLDDLAADATLWQEARGYLSGGDSGTGDDAAGSSSVLAGFRAYLTPTDDTRYLGRLGSYGVVGVVGCGGFGIVLKAFDAALNRFVAIKVLSPALATSGAARQRFAREAKAAAAVMHDNVIAIHAVAEADGLPYFVMPYVSGPSLESRLREAGPLGPVEVSRIGMQIAAGLAAAHAQGLVHRDIKPANILLAEGVERVTITDFGLARAVDDASLTRSGVIAGTPQYMSPEQAAGQTVDHRSDLFSLGSVMYAACTGRPPFRADTTLAVLRRVEDCRPRPIREVNPDIPDWLAEIVDQLHAKDPADRFQSAGEIATLLENWLAHLRQPTTVPAPARRGPEDSPAIADDSSSTLRRFTLAASVATAAVVILLTTGVFRLVTGGEVPQAVVPPSPAPFDVWSTAISRDGKILVAGGGMWEQPGEIGVWDLTTFKPLRRFAEDRGIASVALSPDGKLLASGSWDGHVRIRDWAAGKQVADFEIGSLARVAFSPAGDLLATASEGQTVQLWDVAQGGLVADLDGDMFRFHCVTFSPDGKRVLAGGGDWKAGGIAQVNVWDVASRKQIQKLNGHDKPILALAYSHDGKRIATGSLDSVINLWDGESGRWIKALRGHTNWVESVSFSADDKMLVSGGHDRMIRFWDVEQGTQTFQIGSPVMVRTVQLSADGKTLCVGGGQKLLLALDAATHKQLAVLWNNLPESLTVAPIETLAVTEPTRSSGKPWVMIGVVIGLGLLVALPLRWLVRRQREGAPPDVPVSPPSPLTPLPQSRQRGEKQRRSTAIMALTAASLGGLLLAGFARPSGDAVVGDRRLVGHTGPVHNLRFMPDGRLLSAGGYPNGDRSIRIWDPATGQELSQLFFPGQVHSLDISRNGRFALVGLSGGQVVHLTLDPLAIIRVLHGHTATVGWVAFGPDDHRAYSTAADGFARVWDLDRGIEERRMRVPDKWARGGAVFPDGKRLLTADGRGVLQIWDVANGNEVGRIQRNRVEFIDSVRLLGGGKQALITGVPGARLVDVATAEEIRGFQEQGEEVHQSDISPDGRWLLTAAFDGKVRLWDFETGKLVRVLGSYGEHVWTVAFSADGRWAAAGMGGQKGDGDLVPGTDHDIRLWDLTAAGATTPPTRRRPWLAATGAVMLLIGLAFAGAWFLAGRAGPVGPPAFPSQENGVPTVTRPPITIKCAGCGRSLKAKPEMAGKTAKCPGCGGQVLVPVSATKTEP
jgi:WD40 repeat protein